MKKLILSIFAVSACWASASNASLVVKCEVPDHGKAITITHPATPGNTSANQSPVTYEVSTLSGEILGSGEITQSVFFFFDFLNTLVFEFATEPNISVGLALDGIALESLDKLNPGTYSAKSDLFVSYSDEADGWFDGATVDCTVTYN